MKGFIEVTKITPNSLDKSIILEVEKVVISLRTINWFKPANQRMFSGIGILHAAETLMSCGGDSHNQYTMILKETPDQIKDMIIDAS